MIRPSPRVWLGIGGLWLGLTVLVVAWAVALDQSVGEGPRDSSQPRQVGIEGDAAAAAGSLPPFGMVLNRAVNAEISEIAGDRDAERLRRIAATSENPSVLVDIGVLYQRWSDNSSAAAAFRAALARAPDSIEARTGLIFAEAVIGGGDLERADGRLEALENAHESRQIIVFNRAWLALYRADADAALSGLRETITIDADSPLGEFSRELLEAVEAQGGVSPPGSGG